MRRTYKTLLTFLVIVLGFKLMFTSFHWMNLPSDAAFDGGLALLVITVVAVPITVRSLWRRTR